MDVYNFDSLEALEIAVKALIAAMSNVPPEYITVILANLGSVQGGRRLGNVVTKVDAKYTIKMPPGASAAAVKADLDGKSLEDIKTGLAAKGYTATVNSATNTVVAVPASPCGVVVAPTLPPSPCDTVATATLPVAAGSGVAPKTFSLTDPTSWNRLPLSNNRLSSQSDTQSKGVKKLESASESRPSAVGDIGMFGLGFACVSALALGVYAVRMRRSRMTRTIEERSYSRVNPLEQERTESMDALLE